MDKEVIVDVVYGLFLWAAGYLLGMVFFFFVPTNIIGWLVLPLLFPLTIFVAFKRFKNRRAPPAHYLLVAAAWVLIAIVFDYFFLVKAFSVQNYYDADVFVYYALTFVTPLAVGLKYGKRT